MKIEELALATGFVRGGLRAPLFTSLSCFFLVLPAKRQPQPTTKPANSNEHQTPTPTVVAAAAPNNTISEVGWERVLKFMGGELQFLWPCGTLFLN